MLTDEQMKGNFTIEELKEIKDEIWSLLGFHPWTDPQIIYDTILELRHYARQIK